LEALTDRFESNLGGDGLAIPFKEWRVDLKDLVAVIADDLRLQGGIIGCGEVELDVLADVDFPEDAAGDQNRERAIDRGAGYGNVDGARMFEQLLRGEVFLPGEGGLENSEALVGDAKTVLGEAVTEFFAGGF
jgi:hypothetical protein